MNNHLDRRNFIKTAGAGIAAGTFGVGITLPVAATAQQATENSGSKIRLGMVTYNMGKDMTCDELIALCKKTGLEGVELRTTHAHKVEVELSAGERAEVRKKFEDSGIMIAGLGSAFEFHNEREVEKNVAGAIEYAKLASDVGAPGIKVRPNGVPKGEDPEITYERIGKAWGKVAAAAADMGVAVRMEVHGAEQTRSLKGIRKILDHANHPNALVCWNSNGGEEDENGSIKANFDLVKDSIGLVHITEIGVYQYPWQELFGLLNGIAYSGFCLAEIPENPDPERFMRYYRTLFDLYTGKYHYPNPAIYKEA
jgi:sugar phosphate isomerase/epimerase